MTSYQNLDVFTDAVKTSSNLIHEDRKSWDCGGRTKYELHGIYAGNQGNAWMQQNNVTSIV